MMKHLSSLASVGARRTYAFALAATTLLGPSAGKQPSEPTTEGSRQPHSVPADFEARLQDWLRRAEPFGVTGAIGVLRDTSLTLAAGFGALGPQGGRIGPSTPFILASLSKQFTAAAIVDAAARGRLSLNDTVGKFFSESPAAVRAITVQQLLTHTGGMVYLEPNMFDAQPDRMALMRELLGLPLTLPPGTRWSYSNPGYSVLAGILERNEGKTFETVLRQRLFGPSGMTSTTFIGTPVAGAPHGYQLGEDQGPMDSIPGADRAVGNGSVISTVLDLAKWEVALRTHRVLDDRWTRELFQPRVAAAGGAQYAFGWNVLPTPRGTTLIFHAGDLGPYNAEFRRYVDDGLTIIWLSNARLASSGTRSIVTRVAAGLINGTAVAYPPELAPRDSASERTVLGTYLLPSGDSLFVRRSAGGIVLGARSAGGIAAIGGGTPTADLAGPIAAAIEALQQGDSTQLIARLHPAIGAAGAVDGTRRFLRSIADSLGAPVRVEKLGAIQSDAASATAWLRLRGARGGVIVSYGMAGGRIIAFGNPTEDAAETALRRARDGGFAAFDLTAMRTTSVTIEGKELVVRVADAPTLRARRI